MIAAILDAHDLGGPSSPGRRWKGDLAARSDPVHLHCAYNSSLICAASMNSVPQHYAVCITELRTAALTSQRGSRPKWCWQCSAIAPEFRRVGGNQSAFMRETIELVVSAASRSRPISSTKTHMRLRRRAGPTMKSSFAGRPRSCGPALARCLIGEIVRGRLYDAVFPGVGDKPVLVVSWHALNLGMRSPPVCVVTGASPAKDLAQTPRPPRPTCGASARLLIRP